MSSTDAPTLVVEPLIEVISQSVNEPSTSPSPPLDSENLMDGSDHPPGTFGRVVKTSEFWAPLASHVVCCVEHVRERCSYSQGTFGLLLG